MKGVKIYETPRVSALAKEEALPPSRGRFGGTCRRSLEPWAKTGCLVLVGLLWAGALAVRAATHYVRPYNEGQENPYTTWETAGTNIIEVVNAAMTNTEPRTVWITNGEYRLTNQITLTNNITVQSRNGYSNTLVYADWPAYTTRCFYVVNSGVVDGFTISNGHYVVTNSYNGGGGAYVSNSTIQNCYFTENVCSNTAEETKTGGGGLYLANGVVTNCVFFTNRTFYSGTLNNNKGCGAGIHDWGGSLILGCSFISNRASGYLGGGLYVYNKGNSVVSNCLFAFNYVQVFGGGAHLESGLMTDCVISNNSSGSSGGGVRLDGSVLQNSVIVNNICGGNNGGGGVMLQQNCIVSNCVIAGNSKNGVYRCNIGEDYSALIIDCKISNNFNTSSSIRGGGVYAEKVTFIKNCLIHHNTNMSPGGGGGVYLTNAAVDRTKGGLINCTIVDNWSTNEGGGIAAHGPSNYIVNCVIADNTSFSNNYPNVYFENNAGENSSNFYYSCVVTASAGILAENQGNITNDPAFKDPDAGNWRLNANSPCINTGTNQSWMTNACDLDGNNMRIRYGRVDMGAYELLRSGTIYGFH